MFDWRRFGSAHLDTAPHLRKTMIRYVTDTASIKVLVLYTNYFTAYCDGSVCNVVCGLKTDVKGYVTIDIYLCLC